MLLLGRALRRVLVARVEAVLTPVAVPGDRDALQPVQAGELGLLVAAFL